MYKKKRFAVIIFIGLVLLLGVFAACSRSVSDVSIVIIGHGGEVLVEIDNKDYDNNLVVDILRENNAVLQIPEWQLVGPNAGFITEIAGVEAVWAEEGNRWWWRMDIDGEMSALGILQMRVRNGAVISFTLVAG